MCARVFLGNTSRFRRPAADWSVEHLTPDVTLYRMSLNITILIFKILSPIRRGFAPGFVNYIKGALVYQLVAHGRWFSQGSTASSTTKTGRHDLVEILLKVALKTKIQINKQTSNFI